MHIYVVDDHGLVRDGIISMLKAAGHQVIGECGDGKTAVNEVLRLKPDLVLMDISMPGMNGLEALSLIQKKDPEINVVILTVSNEETHIMDAMQNGARGYLLKSASGEEFLNCVENVKCGDLAIDHRTASMVIKHLMKPSNNKCTGIGGITNRECEILNLVADGQSNKEIAFGLAVSENTIKYHLKKILQKLNVQNRTEAVAKAMRLGIIENGILET